MNGLKSAWTKHCRNVVSVEKTCVDISKCRSQDLRHEVIGNHCAATAYHQGDQAMYDRPHGKCDAVNVSVRKCA